jgi:hypothetical protein
MVRCSSCKENVNEEEAEGCASCGLTLCGGCYNLDRRHLCGRCLSNKEDILDEPSYFKKTSEWEWK